MLIADLDLLEPALVGIVGGEGAGATTLSSLTSSKGGFVSVDVDGQNVLYRDLSSLIPGETLNQSLASASGLPVSFSLMKGGPGNQTSVAVGNGVTTTTKFTSY
jgi:hypothetical protein